MPALGELGELERDLGAGLLGELEGAEQALVVGLEAQHAADHGPVLGHDPERPGERPVLVEQDPDLGRRLAEKVTGHVAQPAGPGEVGARARPVSYTHLTLPTIYSV